MFFTYESGQKNHYRIIHLNNSITKMTTKNLKSYLVV